MPRDLKSTRLMKLKALLFVLITLVASGLLLLRTPEIGSALLLLVALWAACRAYFFLFYVLEHYVDPTFRYRGIWDLLSSLRRKKPGP